MTTKLQTSPKPLKDKRHVKAVAMKNRIQSQLYQQTKGMNSQELIQFYKERGRLGPIKKRKAAA